MCCSRPLLPHLLGQRRYYSLLLSVAHLWRSNPWVSPCPGGFSTVVIQSKSAGRSRMTHVADLLVELFPAGASTELRRMSRIARLFHSTRG